jgi:hypothetical protein
MKRRVIISITNCIIGSCFDPFVKKSFVLLPILVFHIIITIGVASEYAARVNNLLRINKKVHIHWRIYRTCVKDSKKIEKVQTKRKIAAISLSA